MDQQRPSAVEDTFECRLAFSQMLSSLSTGKRSLSQASAYAVSHYQLKDDLFDCFIAELKDVKNSSLYLKNMFILLESICISSMSNGWTGYRDAFEKNCSLILGIIFHPKRHLDYHIQYTLRLCSLLHKRSWFSPKTCSTIEETLDSYLQNCTRSKDFDKITSDKNELMERLEEDREYQKRLREYEWLVPSQFHKYEEVDGLWTSISPVGPADTQLMARDLELCSNGPQIK